MARRRRHRRGALTAATAVRTGGRQTTAAFLTCRLADGVAVGSVAGLVEAVLVYTTSTGVPRSNVVLIFGTNLLLWGATGLGIGAFAALLARRGEWRAVALERASRLVLLLGPILITLARRDLLPGFGWRFLLHWGVPTLLVAAAWLPVQDPGWRSLASFSSFIRLSALYQGASGICVLLRRHDALGTLLRDHASLVAGLPLGFGLFGVLLGLVTQSPRDTGVEPAPPLRGALVTLAGSLAVAAALLGGKGLDYPAPAADLGGGPVGPDILLVVLDTLRADHVSAYGYARKTTPNLDAFAEQATLFEHAYAASSYSLSSHASLFTGLLPSAHGAHAVPCEIASGDAGRYDVSTDYPLENRADTLAELLSRAGYRTGGVAGNGAYLAGWTGLTQGFQYYVGPGRFGYYPLSLVLLNAFPALAHAVSERFGERLDRFDAEQITSVAMRWLAARRRSSSFLFINYFDAHAPYAPPPPYDRRFPAHQGSKQLNDQDVADAVNQGRRSLRSEERDFLVSRYDGEIAFVDAQLGRLLRWLEAEALLDGMLVIVTADHGEAFGEHQLLGHGVGLYEDQIHVPLIVKLPHQREGVRLAQRASLLRTLKLIESVRRGETDAGSLQAQQSMPTSGILSELWMLPHLCHLARDRFPAPMRAVYQGNFKLIERLSPGPNELYDLQSDPTESRDLLRSDAAAAAIVEKSLLAAVPPFTSRAGGAPPPLNPEDLERLRALGYVK